MNDRKTQRKNKTNLVIKWPTNDEYFTIKSLQALNPDFIEITLRVRLNKAITEENLVAPIGTRNCGKGRPELVLAMRPVKQSVLEKAKENKIFLVEDSKLIPVMEINVNDSTPSVAPVTNVVGKTVVTA
jgi:hypothetical protein